MKSNREIAAYALDALLKAGADQAQCIVTTGKADEINVDGGEFSLMRTLFNNAIVLKALKDNKKGIITSNKLDKESIDNAVRDCLAAAQSSMPDEAESISEKDVNKDFEDGVQVFDRDRFFDRIKEYMEDVKREYPKVNIAQLISTIHQAESLFMNTNGVEFSHKVGYYDFSTLFAAQEGKKVSSFMGYGAKMASLDKKLLDIGMHRTLISESEKQIDTKPVNGKFVGKVLITPTCLEEVLGMAFSNFISDSVIIDGTSPWVKQLGNQVVSDKLSISTIPLDSRVVCGERFTGDGYESRNMEIISKGVLKSFLLTNYGSKKTGFPRALNLSGSLFVEPGESSLNDLIQGVDKGILINRFSGGQPGSNGDFSGVAKNSFFIENGKITDAISETMISGNLAKMLKQVIGVSSETVCDGNSVLPWVLCDGITISGK